MFRLMSRGKSASCSSEKRANLSSKKKKEGGREIGSGEKSLGFYTIKNPINNQRRGMKGGGEKTIGPGHSRGWVQQATGT